MFGRTSARAAVAAQAPVARCGDPESERRIMCQALALWETARVGAEAGPRLAAIDLRHPLVGPHFYVLQVPDDPYRFGEATVEHCGGALAAFCGVGRVAAQPVGPLLPPPIRDEMMSYLRAAHTMGKPMAESGSYLCGNGDEVLFRDAIMPLKAEGGQARLLGAISFCRRRVDDQEGPAPSGRPVAPLVGGAGTA